MTQKDILKKQIREGIKTIEDNLDAYESVDATLSESTLLNVAIYVDTANQILEKGFIDDACKEIDNLIAN